MAKTQISNFDKLAEELRAAGLVEENGQSEFQDSGILIINSSIANNIRVSVTTDSKANLVPMFLYQNQNPTLMHDESVNETTVCLEKNKPNTPIGIPFIISPALKAELVSNNVIKNNDITFDKAEITKVDDNNSNILITYPPKFPVRPDSNKSVIGVSIGRNINYELSLIRMSAKYLITGQVVTKTLPVYTSTVDGDFNTFVLIDTSEFYDDAVDISISLSPESTFLDGKLKLNFSHAYTPAMLPSKVELIALDSNWLSAINAVTSDFFNQALDNSRSELSVVGENEYAQSGTTRYLYKMDGDLLKQSWYIKFESLLVDNVGANAVIEIGDERIELNKADILAGSIRVGNYYLYEIVIDNIEVDKVTPVRVMADYDTEGLDYLESTYAFSILVNETQAPEIPLFTFSFLRTRLVVTNENSVLYDGYRYIQFKIPIKESSVVLLDFSDKVTTNVQNKIVSQTSNLVDRPTKAEVMAIANLPSNSLNFTGPMKSLYALDVTDNNPAEVVFQLRLPVGLQMEVGLGVMPVDSKKGYLYQYKAEENYIASEVDPLPGLYRDGSRYQLGKVTGVTKFSKGLLPGVGVAHMKLTNSKDRILLTATDIRTTDILSTGDYNATDSLSLLTGTKANDMHIALNNTGYYIKNKTLNENNTPVYASVSNLPGYVETTAIPDAFLIYRGMDNALYKMAYDVLGGVPVNMIYKVKLIDLDTIGFPANVPLAVNFYGEHTTLSRVIEMTDPYDLTEEDYVTSVPDYEVNMPSFIHIGDIFGTAK